MIQNIKNKTNNCINCCYFQDFTMYCKHPNNRNESYDYVMGKRYKYQSCLDIRRKNKDCCLFLKDNLFNFLFRKKG